MHKFRPPNQLLRVGVLSASQAEQLSARLLTIPGVAEAVVIVEEGLAYLKVDKSILDPAALQDLAPYQANS